MHNALSSELAVIQRIYAGLEEARIPTSVTSVLAENPDVLASVGKLLQDIAWLKEIGVDYSRPTLMDDASSLEVLLAHLGSLIPEEGEVGYIPPGEGRDALTKTQLENPNIRQWVPSWLGGDRLTIDKARLMEIADAIDDIGLELLEVIPIPVLENDGRTTQVLNEEILFQKGIRIGQFLHDVRHAIARRNRVAAFLAG